MDTDSRHPGDSGGELFRLALDAAPTGMLLTDRTGSITLVNAQIERLFGYSRDELIGRPLDILVPERYRAGPAFGDDFFHAMQTRPRGGGHNAGAWNW